MRKKKERSYLNTVSAQKIKAFYQHNRHKLRESRRFFNKHARVIVLRVIFPVEKLNFELIYSESNSTVL